MRTRATASPLEAKVDPKTKILALLNEHRVMSVATVRPDGWPQATMVGYVHDDLTLYFVVARTSQKLANIAREPRISIALGHDTPDRLQGLSMAAHAAEVTELPEIDLLNALLRERCPEQSQFSPRETSTAILRAAPIMTSIIDLAKSPGDIGKALGNGKPQVEGAADEAVGPGWKAKPWMRSVRQRDSSSTQDPTWMWLDGPLKFALGRPLMNNRDLGSRIVVGDSHR